MTINYKIICGIVLLIFSQTLAVNAQETDLKWGLSSQIKVHEFSQNKGSEDVYSYNRQFVTFGAFLEAERFEAKVEALTISVDLDLKYFLWKKMFVTFKGNWDKHNLEIDNWVNYNGYTDLDDVNLFSYMGGIGYESTIFHRLKCQGSVLGGIIHSSKESGSSMISAGYGSNLRAKKTDTYQLEPTFIYGASLELEWLPNASKNRLRPIAPFISLSIAGTNESRTYRQVSIEEWVEGNVVYQEENRPSNRLYDFVDVNFRMGIKLYIKK